MASVDPVLAIDPTFQIDGVPANQIFRLEYSPNLAPVPLPTTALPFPTGFAAALAWRRRKRAVETRRRRGT
ncbi:MAG: hypothetical protein IT486_06385 [Gammaproteobacteria bacterium]|nr:hypothetical protein [Gammaproteobacteria bacterium]